MMGSNCIAIFAKINCVTYSKVTQGGGVRYGGHRLNLPLLLKAGKMSRRMHARYRTVYIKTSKKEIGQIIVFFVAFIYFILELNHRIVYTRFNLHLFTTSLPLREVTI